MSAPAVCRECGIALDDTSWSPGRRVRGNRQCRKCNSKASAEWRKANPGVRCEENIAERAEKERARFLGAVEAYADRRKGKAAKRTM